MGEYEDRYPEAYGRPEDTPPIAVESRRTAEPPRPVRETPAEREMLPTIAPGSAVPSAPATQPGAVALGEYEARYPEAYGRPGEPPAAFVDRRRNTEPSPPLRAAPGERATRVSQASDPTPAAVPAPTARPPAGAGEYEDRYPEAYRRDDAPPAVADRRRNFDAVERRETRELQASGRGLGGLWQHGRDQQPAASPPAQPRIDGPYRGLGPRGYTRLAERIREDLCDRLTEDPFLDASDIEVVVAGTPVTRNGAVENRVSQRQAQSIAESVVGVTGIRNNLRVRQPGERRPS